MLFKELISEIYLQLKNSEIAYNEYLNNGKKYKDAINLKKINSSIWKILIENSNLLSAELKQDSAALTEHYKIWTEKWEKLKNELNPQQEDEFFFQNEHTFPKDAANNFEKEYINLNEK